MSPVTLALLMAASPATAPFGDTLTLDLANPMIEVAIGGETLRLRVDLDQKDAIELNPAVASRLGLTLDHRYDASVGRVTVPGRIGSAAVTIGGREFMLPIATHDRPCCTDSDGLVSPTLLPYAGIRFTRPGPPAREQRSFPLVTTEPAGAFVREETPEGRLAIQFSLRYLETLATASSAAILAKLHGGSFAGPAFSSARAFGIARPARMMQLGEPAPLAGFPIDRLAVRIADFRGGFVLPSDPAEPGEIAVSGKGPPSQHAWPAVIIGREALDRCSEIVVRRAPPTISLRCDFGAAR